MREEEPNHGEEFACEDSGLVLSFVAEPTGEAAEDALFRMGALDRAAGAIDLRRARLMAWLKHKDLTPLGYSTPGALFDEVAGLGNSQSAAMVALADSKLDLVKAAVSKGLISMRTALRAPSEVEVDEQLAWVLSAIRGELGPPPRRHEPSSKIEVSGETMRIIAAARDRARLCIGRPVSDLTADYFILDCWRKQRPGHDIIAEGKEPRPPPDPDPVPWGPEDDLATPLLGPWIEPNDVAHAVTLLQQVVERRESRTVELGVLYRWFVEMRAYRHAGFGSIEELCRTSFQADIRTLQRYSLVAEGILTYPELAEAVKSGLGLARALEVTQIADEDTVERWITVARRTGIRELRRATKLAASTGAEAVLAAYEEAIRRTDADAATSAGSRVALRASRRPPPPRKWDEVHPDLPVAAAWFLATVVIAPQTGFAKVKDRERFTCENPECSRRTLRCDAHHRIWRSWGGTDDDINAECDCKACHLRLIHPGKIKVEMLADGSVLWTYPGRKVRVF